MSCAAALATLQVYQDDRLLQNTKQMERVMAEGLAGLKARHPSVGDVRGIGLFWIIELAKDRDTHEQLVPWNAKPSELGPMPALARYLRQNDLYTFTKWNWIYIVPPLCINREQIEEGLAIIHGALEIADASLEDNP
jgi:taurine--2-oxoglutarate transaminase